MLEWWIVLILFFVSLITLIFCGMPVAFSFLSVNLMIASIVIGFDSGIKTLVFSAYQSISSFSLTPIPLFVLMGELLFHSGLVMKVLDVLSKLMGRIPSRLSILTIVTGTMFSALSGSATANSAMLGSALAPEMRQRGYHLNMIVGPILGAGALAAIIPPSGNAILMGSIGRISIGDLLIACVIPGLIISILLIAYFLIIGKMNPSLAPAYEMEESDRNDRLRSFFMYVFPLLLLIVGVLGMIFSGFTTPTEAAAIGALGSLMLPICYGRLNRTVLKKSAIGTVKVSGMILLILAASAGFSQLLAFTGATRGLVEFTMSMETPPILTIIVMLLIVLILGTFIDPISIMMITIPLYLPIVTALEFDLVWFGVLMLICLDLGNITPPFGLLLFVIKGVLPEKVSMKEIYKGVIAVLVLNLVAVILILVFPEIVLWLPSISGSNG
ncbi:TRAP transporter large permease subunit [Ammoniphilus sp. YIM 78166]|uniref:TRAP transporter large permease n=1 Tax=Ammoniphilus sp. YIM 78166 TaxID=1644106 RepID=UPI00106F1426|nr:TRAP transporter large permease subunit [Ammoniphilus sp. YIM 78166]